jgi:DNA adenine methylase
VRLVKRKQIEILKALSRYSRQIDISNLDALEFFRAATTKKNSLVYLDPPYFIKGHKLYKNFYEPEDHIEIARELKRKRNANWVVSYDDVPEIRDFYDSFPPITYFLNYSAGEKTIGTEVIFVSDSIVPPNVQGFQVAA